MTAWPCAHPSTEGSSDPPYDDPPPFDDSIGPKGELAGALDEDRMERVMDELEKATGGAIFMRV